MKRNGNEIEQIKRRHLLIEFIPSDDPKKHNNSDSSRKDEVTTRP